MTYIDFKVTDEELMRIMRDRHVNLVTLPYAAPTTGTLSELGVEPGDVVALAGREFNVLDVCDDRGYLLCRSDIPDEGGRFPISNSYQFRIVSRASDAKPTPTGPVITETVTTKRIVPGVYGRISIHKNTDNDGKVLIRLADGAGEVNLNNCGHYMSRAELIAARDILSQLIDAMPEE